MNKLIGILKTLIAGYIITIALLIIISICMYKMSLSNNIISILLPPMVSAHLPVDLY